MRVLNDLAKIPITWPFENFAKMFSSVCTLNAYKLEDNAICARVLLGLSNEGYFFGNFFKISLDPPFALFLENAGFG